MAKKDLARLSKLCDKLADLDKTIEGVMAKLADLKEKRDHLSEVAIPDFMAEHGLSEVRLASSGTKVLIKPVVRAHISAQRRPEAHSWLRKHGLGDLIKHELKVPFGKGEETMAKAVMRELRKRDVKFTDREHVHHSTLNAWAREALMTGGPIDLDLFGVFTSQTTKLEKG